MMKTVCSKNNNDLQLLDVHMFESKNSKSHDFTRANAEFNHKLASYTDRAGPETTCVRAVLLSITNETWFYSISPLYLYNPLHTLPIDLAVLPYCC